MVGFTLDFLVFLLSFCSENHYCCRCIQLALSEQT